MTFTTLTQKSFTQIYPPSMLWLAENMSIQQSQSHHPPSPAKMLAY
jgi:hypothetical protein